MEPREPKREGVDFGLLPFGGAGGLFLVDANLGSDLDLACLGAYCALNLVNFCVGSLWKLAGTVLDVSLLLLDPDLVDPLDRLISSVFDTTGSVPV